MNKEEREKLKDQVMDMILTGYSQRDISHKLGISLRVIVTYVKSRKAEAIAEMRDTAEEQMAEMEISKRKRIKKLWTIVLDDSKKQGDKTKAIQLLQQEDVLSIKRKQIIGLLPQDVPAIAIQNNNVIEGVTTIADSIRRRCPELLEKFVKKKMIKKEVVVDPWVVVVPESSNVLKYSFNSDLRKLRVWFKSAVGSFYEYDCSADIFEGIKDASSVGSFISSVFKGSKFVKRKEGDDK